MELIRVLNRDEKTHVLGEDRFSMVTDEDKGLTMQCRGQCCEIQYAFGRSKFSTSQENPFNRFHSHEPVNQLLET